MADSALNNTCEKAYGSFWPHFEVKLAEQCGLTFPAKSGPVVVVPDAASSADGLFGYDVDVALGARNRAWVFSGAPKVGFIVSRTY